MKNKKGFTLIELLAVIVILAIIALIATPAIINIIENARKKAFEDTSYGVLEGLRLDYVERTAQGIAAEEKTFTFPNSGLKLSGEEPAYGEAKIDSKGNISFALADKDKKWCTKKEANSEKVYVEDYTEENCKIDGTTGGGDVPESVSFAEDSWETIAANVKAGNLSKYKVGDEKEVTLTGEYAGTYTVRIANTSKPAECDGADFSQSACGFVVEFVDIITKSGMNSTSINKGGWPASKIRNLVNTNIYNSLPEDLKKEIVYTEVVSSHGSDDPDNFKSTDKLYLLATKEVWGKDPAIHYGGSYQDSSMTQSRQLDYYQEQGVTELNYGMAVKQFQNSNFHWCLRSSILSTKSNFYSVHSSGGPGNGPANTSIGVAPAFRIG